MSILVLYLRNALANIHEESRDKFFCVATWDRSRRTTLHEKTRKDTYTRVPGRSIVYMCNTQKAVTEANIPTNSKSFRQMMRSVRPTNMIYGDHGCINFLASVVII